MLPAAAYQRGATPSFLSWGSLKQAKPRNPAIHWSYSEILDESPGRRLFALPQGAGRIRNLRRNRSPLQRRNPREPGGAGRRAGCGGIVAGQGDDASACWSAIWRRPASSSFWRPMSCRRRRRTKTSRARSSRARWWAKKMVANGRKFSACDEHLKNAKGFLGLTPLSPVAGWRIQYEQDPVRGLQLYFTPVASAQRSARAADRGALESQGEALPDDGSQLRAVS